MSDSDLNSFQVPNAYVDQYMHLLTSDEFKVLTYAVRHSFGFNKWQNRIGVSQFESGLATESGEIRDHGTGLSVDAIQKALASLIRARIVRPKPSNDPAVNNVNIKLFYVLQLDSDAVDMDYLVGRTGELT